MTGGVTVGGIFLLLISACSSGAAIGSTVPASAAGTEPGMASTTIPPTASTISATTPTATTLPTARPIRAPGEYAEADLEIHIGFRSEIPDLTSEQFAEAAMAILGNPTGWARAGFTFVHDEGGELIVVLAEGSRVDELCLPLETYGTVSCQNGPVVALNADRWRQAWNGWGSTVETYRHYLVTHEVGHLIGLRHPVEKCTTGRASAAVMSPQTRTTLTCPVNSVPLDWEIQWAQGRPAVIGPAPDWDGPNPTWPEDS